MVSQYCLSLRFLTILFILLLAGCAAHRPVLYPNAHLKRVGEAHAQKDIDECCRQAEAYIKANPGAKIAGSTAAGGATGAVVGGAMGSVTGHLGRGAAVGAAGGAAGGFMRGLFRASKPSPVYKNFVDRCLREKGYEPLGWE
ncbi:MAG: cell envelope biogenesis protein OmpA [Deltaproteobacteria bacterium]|nr:cell envelope biogenesis protein OmpA [Deltaproteobacteria bacterium]